MWTHKDRKDLLPNITVRENYQDGELKFYELFPDEGYLLHIPSGDAPIFDEEGNPTGEVELYHTEGGNTELVGYDFESNPENYHADLKGECGDG